MGPAFLVWLSDALRLMRSEELSPHIRRHTGVLLEASLSSVLVVDGTRTAVRRSVLLAIDVNAGAERVAEVERFCLEHSSQFGVLVSFLISNGPPDARTQQILARHRVLHVTVADGDADTPPTPESIGNLRQLLLGAVPVGNVLRQLEQLEAGAETADGDDGERLLEAAYLTLLSLYHAEWEFLGDGARRHRTVGIAGTGVHSAIVEGYAVQSYPSGGGSRHVYLPSLDGLERGLSLAATAYDLALRLERGGVRGPTAEAVSRVSRLFLSYYLSWLDGRGHVLDGDGLRREREAFVGAPHISLVSAGLPDRPPVEQLTFLDLLEGVRAREATQDLLDGIEAMVPKVQQRCLEALARFGTLEDIRPLEPFILSPRESLRDAALAVIGRMGGDAAAATLSELLNAELVPMSVAFLDAVASTRSPLALRNLIIFGAGRGQAEPPVFGAIESCLDGLGVDGVRGAGPGLVPAGVLERYVAFLLDAGATRLALKLIGAFELAACFCHVERALRDESLVTRVNAIRVVPLVPSDRLVQAMVDALAHPPDDYEQRKLLEWMTSNLHANQHRAERAGRITGVADLDLRTAVMAALTKVDTDLARTLLAGLAAEAPDDTPDGGGAAPHEAPGGWPEIPLLNSIFACPGELTVWVSHGSREREPDTMAMASLIHGNRFADTQSSGEAASMLSGGMSLTQGTEREIFNDVVLPCLRGERPRFPISAGMGESVTTKIEDGRTVVTGRRDLHAPDAADREE
ncbi:HEAT repeat domain-containing protein [Dactylosporangium aurantiacum]|uniref:HEAT repeat domain-containing protein n=1 Tax=Dactylosporangium aurantiacum TaxID=35754 RepID=A0A9Q9MGF6_9ACTN|nr:HEAT repeat domain-containing protein [Dactylosporangium aurantiacum]MDG6105050.1 HEAT repeat domain-containing protein [Dactylosporangium aurantiacum]UWZ51581.1 HEAT repeat domain-containing protein [Dactylosporangium aurantiacum]